MMSGETLYHDVLVPWVENLPLHNRAKADKVKFLFIWTNETSRPLSGTMAVLSRNGHNKAYSSYFSGHSGSPNPTREEGGHMTIDKDNYFCLGACLDRGGIVFVMIRDATLERLQVVPRAATLLGSFRRAPPRGASDVLHFSV